LLGINHKIIGEKIAAELKFSPEATKLFLSGITGPDSHGDFPHFKGKDGKILYSIDEARTLFLENDDYCYCELGNALHYIQDKWSNEQTNERFVKISDELLLKQISKSDLTNGTKKNYLQKIALLSKIKNNGIDSWFNPSWGFFHKDFASCVYVFVDVLELTLPKIKPEIYGAEIAEMKSYLKSENLKTSIKDGLFFSIKENFLKPKLSGYPAAIYLLAKTSPPSEGADLLLNLNIAFRLSLEISKLVLAKPQDLKHSDKWTQKREIGQKIGLGNILPEYHILIIKPLEEIYQKRKAFFEKQVKTFLSEQKKPTHKNPILKHRSEIWDLLFGTVIELLPEYFKETQ